MFLFVSAGSTCKSRNVNNFKTKALQLSGDIELNTGPNEIIRSVQSSFSEGNVLLFGKTSGC